MATPLDLGLFQHFQIIFPFLLVFAIVYGVLSYTKIFGENRLVYGLLAVFLGLVATFSTIARETINIMAPWFIILFFFLVFLLVAFRIFGVSEGSITSFIMSGKSNIGLWITAFGLIVFFGSIATVISNQGGIGVTPANASATLAEGAEQGTAANQQTQFWATLVNPKVLGFILIMLIATFAVTFIAKGTKV